MNPFQQQADLERFAREHDDRVIPREILNAEEVAESILEHGFSEIDYSEWKTLDDSDKAEAFDELIALVAGQRREPCLNSYENQSEWLNEIKDSLLETLKFWAEREIRTKSVNGLEKD